MNDEWNRQQNVSGHKINWDYICYVIWISGYVLKNTQAN